MHEPYTLRPQPSSLTDCGATHIFIPATSWPRARWTTRRNSYCISHPKLMLFSYRGSGDFVASCSMDHTAKLWDVERAKCRGTLRGHVDSINAIIFQPFSNNICTCAGDKTVSPTALCLCVKRLTLCGDAWHYVCTCCMSLPAPARAIRRPRPVTFMCVCCNTLCMHVHITLYMRASLWDVCVCVRTHTHTHTFIYLSNIDIDIDIQRVVST